MLYPRPTYFIHGCLAALGVFTAMAVRGLGDSAQEGIPTANPKSRYEALVTKSPFALATAPAPVTQQAPFAANWFVSGIARVGETYFVIIKSRDKSKQFTLFGGEPDIDTGCALVSVDWSDAVGRSTVVIRKGAETAKLEFNEAEVRTTPAGTAPIQMAAAAPAPAVAENPGLGLPRGAAELSGIKRIPNPSRMQPSVTPPPGNGPARVPWDAGAVTAARRGAGGVQPH